VRNPILGHVNKGFVKVLGEKLSAKLDGSLATEEQKELAHCERITLCQLVQHRFDQIMAAR